MTDFHTREWVAQAHLDSLREEAAARRALRLLGAGTAPHLLTRLWRRLTGKAHRDHPTPA